MQMKEKVIKFKLTSVLFATLINCLYVFKCNIPVIEFTIQILPIFPKYIKELVKYEFQNSATVTVLLVAITAVAVHK